MASSRACRLKLCKLVIIATFTYSLLCVTGGEQQEAELAALGLLTFAASGENGADNQSGVKTSSIATMPPATSQAHQSLVSVGTGLPAIPKKLVEKILSGEYVDFCELPPMKGKGRPSPQVGEGQIVVLHAADLASSKKAIPDLVTWLQCFSLYVAVVAAKQPGKVADLMAYQVLITKASQSYRLAIMVSVRPIIQARDGGKEGPDMGKGGPLHLRSVLSDRTGTVRTGVLAASPLTTRRHHVQRGWSKNVDGWQEVACNEQPTRRYA